MVRLPPKLFVSGEIYFWKWRQAACSRWKFTCFYGILSKAAFLSLSLHPTTSCQFLLYTHTHTQKQTHPPNLKKPKLGVFILLLSRSPSVLLLLLWPSVVLLFSLRGIASRIATSGTVRGAISAVEGWWERRHSDICQLGERMGWQKHCSKKSWAAEGRAKLRLHNSAKKMALCISFILRNLNCKICRFCKHLLPDDFSATSLSWGAGCGDCLWGTQGMWTPSDRSLT